MLVATSLAINAVHKIKLSDFIGAKQCKMIFLALVVHSVELSNSGIEAKNLAVS